MKRKKLVIISHTEHFRTHEGIIKGWGPTINEINYLSNYWEEVVHVGCLHQKPTPPSALPYTSSNITFAPIPAYGGKSIKEKLLILVKIPKIIAQVVKNVKGASEVQLRLPTSMGLFLLPLFSFFLPRRYTFWVKYAGSWNQDHAAFASRLQHWWLKKNLARCKVTINGFWNDQPTHCYSFENPCLTEEDIARGAEIARNKSFEGSYVFAFVGRLEDSKGVTRIIEALKEIPAEKIKEVHFVGNGHKTEEYVQQAYFLGDKVHFHGFLDKTGVHSILQQSHFFLLPSDSEGFPKVIAEAACYGVIPIVSNVGSIAHYVTQTNGFVWNKKGNTTYPEILNQAVTQTPKKLKELSENCIRIAEMFTFDNYKHKLESLVFCK